MSYFADKYIIDKETGDVKLLKHLNKCRIHRGYNTTPGGWNKSGSKARLTSNRNKCEFYNTKSVRKQYCINKLNEEEQY